MDSENQFEIQAAIDSSSQNADTSSQDGQYSKKSRLASTLFSFFLGQYGVHNFYAGRIAPGIIKIVLSLFSFILMFSAVSPFLKVGFENLADPDGIEEAMEDLAYEEMIEPIENAEDDIEIIKAVFTAFDGLIIKYMISMFVLLGTGIWIFVEFILCVSGNYKDRYGKKIKIWVHK